MKFVKLLRPLFLVALGLHGLVLFLPIGGSSETAEIEVAEETALAQDPAVVPGATTAGQLPVPDLNVTAGGAIAGAAPVLANSASAPVVSAQPAPAALSRTATRSAPLALAVPGVAAARAIPTGGASRSPSTPSSEITTISPPLELPNVEAADTGDRPNDISANNKVPADENAAENSQTTDSSNQPDDSESNRSLIASAIGKFPDSLKALMDRWAIMLAYSPTGTSDRNAETAQSEWTDKINAQASGIEMGRQVLEPVKVENFAEVSYPIEASVRDQAPSFRICLDPPPSTPAEVGVLFDSSGEIVGELELIRSAGYKAINDEAIATVESSETWPDNRASKAFVFEVAIDYDKEACAKLSELKD